jgi:hypothetical protein
MYMATCNAAGPGECRNQGTRSASARGVSGRTKGQRKKVAQGRSAMGGFFRLIKLVLRLKLLAFQGMAEDLIYTKSTGELQREIQQLVCRDDRSLLPKAKVFAAVATLQRFDALPEVVSPEELNELLAADRGIEIQRGIGPSDGVPASFYAKELLLGSMHPGTRVAFGNGIYFATVSEPGTTPHFPKKSVMAQRYLGCGPDPGVIIRAILRTNTRCIDLDSVEGMLLDQKNRARKAGIMEVGAFAAAQGYDAIYADNRCTYTDERTYIVLNRGALIVQNVVLSQLPNSSQH